MSGPWREDERILDYLKAKPAVFGKLRRELHEGGPHAVCRCPFCEHKGKLNCNLETTQWDCKSCGESGNLRTLQRKLGDLKPIGRSTGSPVDVEPGGIRRGGGGRGGGRGGAAKRKSAKRKPKPKDAQDFHERLMARAEGDEAAAQVWDWLTGTGEGYKRHYTETEILEFKLGVAEFPCGGDDKIQEMQGGKKPRGGRGSRGRKTADHATDGEGPGGACTVCGGKGDKIAYASIPFFDRKGTLVNFKYRSVPPYPKHWRRFPGGESTLLHAHRLDLGLPEDVKLRKEGASQPPVILVEGEWDVIALSLMGYANVTTFPTGASGRVQEAWADMLAKVEAFIICYDQDGAGRTGAERVSIDLGRSRCWMASLPANDANECLVQGLQQGVSEALASAEVYRPSRLVEAKDLRERVRQRLMNPELYYGISTGWRSLDNLIGGLRPGLTVWTSHSGSGKTTFTTAMACNLAERGDPILVCPFETSVEEGIEKALWRVNGCDPGSAEGLRKFDGSYDILDGWPLYWLQHKGSIPLIALKETVYYAAVHLGIKCLVLDHLDYFVQQQPGEDAEWKAIKRTLQALDEWGHELKLPIQLVVHPSGKPDNEQVRVQMTDLRGGAAAWQIPQMIIGIHRPRTKTRKTGKKAKETGPVALLSVLKMRAAVGKEGEIALDFLPDSESYRDPGDDPGEVELP